MRILQSVPEVVDAKLSECREPMKIEVLFCMGVVTLPCAWRMQRAPSSIFGEKGLSDEKEDVYSEGGSHESLQQPLQAAHTKSHELTEKLLSVREDLDKTSVELQAKTNRVNQLLQVIVVTVCF